MNDEIKEILDYISDRVIEKEKWNKVKDYIINLQEELEYKELWRKEYKQRIDKAIEYIENEMPYLEEPDEEIERIDGSIYMTMKEYDKNIILNILQNGSEEK
jgi:hypothetical protein